MFTFVNYSVQIVNIVVVQRVLLNGNKKIGKISNVLLHNKKRNAHFRPVNK